MPAITVGRIVLYKLSDHDELAINKRRDDYRAFLRNRRAGSEDTGYVAHVGNQVRAGDEYPAVVVRAWPGQGANLQVLLDGNDTYWATSRIEGLAPNTWYWSERVEEPAEA